MAWLLCRSLHGCQVCKHTYPWSSWTPAGSAFPPALSSLLVETLLGEPSQRKWAKLWSGCATANSRFLHIYLMINLCTWSRTGLAASFCMSKTQKPLCCTFESLCGSKDLKGSMTFLHSTMTPSDWCGTHCTDMGESALLFFSCGWCFSAKLFQQKFSKQKCVSSELQNGHYVFTVQTLLQKPWQMPSREHFQKWLLCARQVWQGSLYKTDLSFLAFKDYKKLALFSFGEGIVDGLALSEFWVMLQFFGINTCNILPGK